MTLNEFIIHSKTRWKKTIHTNGVHRSQSNYKSISPKMVPRLLTHTHTVQFVFDSAIYRKVFASVSFVASHLKIYSKTI